MTYMNLSVLGLIPLGVEQQIPCIAELLNFFRVEVRAVWYSEGVVVRHLILIDPLCHLVLVSVLDIATQAVEIPTVVERRPSTLLTTLGEILFP